MVVNQQEELRKIILKQKEERDRLLLEVYFERNYPQGWDDVMSSDLIKVILGPRRAGKSVFAISLLKKLDFIYFNFEEYDSKKYASIYTLLDELENVFGKTKYILFDEIQELPGWEVLANMLHRRGYNLVLTGSNAKLLSGELATSLTGRHIPIEILPFSLGETVRAKNQNPQTLLEEYFIKGGYPQVVLQNAYKNEYLENLLESVLFKDIVKRFNVRIGKKISELCNYLLNNSASLYSAKSIAKSTKLGSDKTIEKYIQYMVGAYIFFSLQKYSFKYSESIAGERKIYTVDTGFLSVRKNNLTEDKGKIFENLVFVELLKKGHKTNRDLFYFKTKEGKEVDFLIKKNLEIVELIQVCYDISHLETKEREVSALASASKELKCDNLKIITWAQDGEIVSKGKKIQVMSILNWLGLNN